MNNNNIERKKSGSTFLFVLLIITVLGLSSYIVYDRFFVNDDSTKETSIMSKGEAKEIAQGVYSNAYSEAQEGADLVDRSQIYQKNYMAGGFLEDVNKQLNCYKLDLSGIENLFTEKALDKIKKDYAESYNDGYYRCSGTDDFSYVSKLESLTDSIFGIVDQDERDLNVIAFDSNTIIATGQLEPCTDEYCSGSGDEYPLYIIFKNINGKWLIDSFE